MFMTSIPGTTALSTEAIRDHVAQAHLEAPMRGPLHVALQVYGPGQDRLDPDAMRRIERALTGILWLDGCQIITTVEEANPAAEARLELVVIEYKREGIPAGYEPQFESMTAFVASELSNRGFIVTG